MDQLRCAAEGSAAGIVHNIAGTAHGRSAREEGVTRRHAN
jgi:hypothetical protein